MDVRGEEQEVGEVVDCFQQGFCGLHWEEVLMSCFIFSPVVFVQFMILVEQVAEVAILEPESSSFGL